MSSDSLPITAQRFAAALADLPLPSLYAKVSELQNSIAHLERSNKELEDYARENDDRDCYEALLENREVLKRFEERIDLVKREVMEVRGLPWQPEDAAKREAGEENKDIGVRDAAQSGASTGAPPETNGAQEQRNGTSAAEEEGVFL